MNASGTPQSNHVRRERLEDIVMEKVLTLFEIKSPKMSASIPI